MHTSCAALGLQSASFNRPETTCRRKARMTAVCRGFRTSRARPTRACSASPTSSLASTTLRPCIRGVCVMCDVQQNRR